MYLEIGTKNEASSFITLESAICGTAVASSKSINMSSKPDCIRFRMQNYIYSEYLITFRNNSNCTGAGIVLQAGQDVNISFDFASNFYLTPYTPSENLVSVCDKIKIMAPEDYNPEFYDWQYAIGSGNWINLTAFKGNNVLEVGINDLLNAPTHTQIHFRLRNCGGLPNTLTYVFTECSPKIHLIEPRNATCFYSKDGGFLVEFERTLTIDEKINFNLFKFTGIVDNVKQYQFLSDKFNQIYGNDKLYIWPDPLEKGEYYIKYQLVPIGENISSEVFIIDSPSSLQFEIVKADNPKCSDDLVGVDIEVTGGTGDYKFYVDGIEKTSPKPVKEIDGYYHIIGLVPTDINSIKVMDENNCIEKTL
ncbi:hypothetical protein [Flavobacterium sp.]|uniref:hypothetical protein n=1 Tax=Flavobacterium sp. TaxID=239 RepID=UPI003267CEB8